MIPAKFAPPRPTRILERERLLDRLAQWEDRKLVVIHAQAGQGKTTLAAAYCRTLASPPVWYTMDPEDDDPRYFLSSLGRALQPAFPADLPRIPLLPPAVGPAGLAVAAAAWAGQVFSLLSRPCLIVLDDLHVTASSTALLTAIMALVEKAPAPVRFLVLSRTRPDLNTTRLRAQRSYGELSGTDLRFSTSEVEELYNGVFGMHLPSQAAAIINKSAEGWPAGLVLMHEYLAAAGPGSWTSLLSPGNRKRMEDHIFEYLAQEVFRHLTPELQRFLMRTSLSDAMPLPLAGQLTSASPARVAAWVDEVLRKNLFISPLDEKQPVIRYHSLFREFLQKKLLVSEGHAVLASLTAASAAFFLKAGDPVRAVEVLLTFGQDQKAMRAIKTCAAELIGRGQVRTLLRWQETLPLAEQASPWFLLARAISCRFTDPKAALGLFEDALKGFRTTGGQKDQTGAIVALCGIIEECFHSGGDFGRMEKAAVLAHRLLGKSRRESAPARARLLLAMGMASFFTGSLGRSRDSLLQALALFTEQGDAFHQITCTIYLTPCALYQGDFRLAREVLQRGFDAHTAIPDEAGGKAGLLLTRAMTALFEGSFGEAGENIARCKELAGAHSLSSIELLSLTIAGWLAMAQGDLTHATALLTECKSKASRAGSAFFTGSAAHLLAITFLFQNKLARAERESNEALGIRSGKGSKLFHAIYLIASGAINLRLGKAGLAGRELRSALRTLKQAKALQQEANCHLVLAMLEQRNGSRAGFLRHLRRGFSIGRERGFTYYAVLTPEEQASLAQQAVAEDICRDYCMSLLEDRAGRPLLSIYCMGEFQVLRGTRKVREAEWKSKRARTLLKLLVAHEGLRLPKEQAMDLLWPENDGDKNPAMFNSLLHRLRRVIEPGASKDVFCIGQDEGMIVLNRTLVWTDVGQFKLHLERAGRLRSQNRKSDLLQEYERALALYQGDFLADEVYCDWSAPLRDHLRTSYLRTLEEAGELADAAEDRGKALQLFERLFLSEPSHEKACRWLMARYHSLDRRGDAIRTYERCERALSREMDLEPEEKTKRLYRSIIGG